MDENQLREEISCNENKIAGYEDESEENSKKIERLKEARDIVKMEEETIEDCKEQWNELSATVESDLLWYGSNEALAREYIYTIDETDLKGYLDNINITHDLLCDEITRLENRNTEIGGLIGALYNIINSLQNEIYKLCN